VEKNAWAGVLLVFYLAAFIAFSAWFLFSGGINEPARQVFYFLKMGQVESQTLSISMVFGFVLLDLLLSVFVAIFLRILTGISSKTLLNIWKKLLNMPAHLFFYNLTAFVAAEEIFFRWLPLAVLWPMLGKTQVNLWILIIVSSVIFGVLHIGNQAPDDRKVVYTLPQIIGGIFLSYIFLAFGFLGAVLIHLSINVALLVLVWLYYRYDHNGFENLFGRYPMDLKMH